MNSVTGTWQVNGNPALVGFHAMPGERCQDTTTGIVYVKQGTSDIAWITGSACSYTAVWADSL